jgi:hypothetical protein
MKAIGATFGYIIYGALILSWPIGMYHSYKKHSTKDFIGSIVLFPWGMYRGFEMFWHKDEDKMADVDWKKRLSNDLRASIYLLTEGSYKDHNVVDLNKATETYTDQIKDYPKDKKQYLINGTREYIKYTLSCTNEITIIMTNYFASGKMDISYSDSTIALKKDLIDKYELSELIAQIDAALNQQAKQMAEAPITDTAAVRKLKTTFKENMDIYMTKTRSDMARIFKDIYNEEL